MKIRARHTIGYDDEYHPPGSIIEMSPKEAKRLIERGAADHVTRKKLPDLPTSRASVSKPGNRMTKSLKEEDVGDSQEVSEEEDSHEEVEAEVVAG